MFTFRLQNPDGTPADKPTFCSSEPDWHVGDKVLIGCCFANTYRISSWVGT